MEHNLEKAIFQIILPVKFPQFHYNNINYHLDGQSYRLFFFTCLANFLRFIIISYNASKPS